MKPLCYVFGPYNAPTAEGIMSNVASATTMAKALMLKGYRVYVPHSMTMGWTADDDDDFLKMHMAMIPLCHCAFGLQGWEDSRGSRLEYDYLKRNGIPMFFSTSDMPDAEKFEYDIPSLEVEDILERRRFGVQHYGQPLSVGSNIEALTEAYNEAGDLRQYLRVEIEKAKLTRPPE